MALEPLGLPHTRRDRTATAVRRRLASLSAWLLRRLRVSLAAAHDRRRHVVATSPRWFVVVFGTWVVAAVVLWWWVVGRALL